MEERKRKILEEVEFVIHASSIYNDFLNIFTSGSYSNWWLYCDSLTEEEVIAEIKKLYTLFEGKSQEIHFMQFRPMLKFINVELLEECKKCPPKSIQKKSLELLMDENCDIHKFKRNYLNSSKTYFWLLLLLFKKLKNNNNAYEDLLAQLTDCNLDDRQTCDFLKGKECVNLLDDIKGTDSFTDTDVQFSLDTIETIGLAEVAVVMFTIVFELLNCRLIIPKQKEQFIDTIKEKYDYSVSLEIQEGYDRWKNLVPYKTMNWKFDKIRREFSFPSHFANKNKQTMCLNLTQRQVTVLYTELWHKGYISDGVDAWDFGFAICGKPYQRKLINKIDWLKSKISFLTLFGELSNKEENQHYWCKLVDLFTWQGKDFTQKGLSAQYKKHINEPPKRKNKEVEEIKEIVALIKSIKE